MGLQCNWGSEWDGDGWYLMRREKCNGVFHAGGKREYDIEFFRPLWTKRSRKCKSCGTKITPGASCVLNTLLVIAACMKRRTGAEQFGRYATSAGASGPMMRAGCHRKPLSLAKMEES